MPEPDEQVGDPTPEPEPVPVEETPEAHPAEDSLPLPGDRPARNVLAEMQRKYTKIERQNSELLSALQGLQHAPAPAPVQGAEYTDEQLAQLAAAGNSEAIQVLVSRQTQRATGAQFAHLQQVSSVQQALGHLFTRYPMLQQDPGHPLTQAVYQARQHFLANGWQPGLLTDLEAIKAAIVSAPHLTAPGIGGGDTTRRAGVAAQQSIDGAASRRSPQAAATAAVRPLNRRVAGIAQRMNVKDPQGALKRFEARQAAGRSSVSPMIIQAIREEHA
jgi:hypothetical protein